MRVHANAKLGPAGRLALVRKIDEGRSLRAAAQESSVSVATAHRWWHRWLEADATQRASGVWLQDRSSRPHRQPRRLSADARGADLRGPGGDGLGAAVGRRRDRAAASDGLEGAPPARPLAPAARRSAARPTATNGPAPATCCTWTSARYAALPSARAPRDRRSLPTRPPLDDPATRVGYDYAHAIVDDHSRLAYVELHDDESAATVTAFVERALASSPATASPRAGVMTDNAFTYVKNRSLRELLAAHGIRHLTTQPYRPRTNGKVCVLALRCRPSGRRGSPRPVV